MMEKDSQLEQLLHRISSLVSVALPSIERSVEELTPGAIVTEAHCTRLRRAQTALDELTTLLKAR
jgi:hypothetical protein